MQGNGKYNINNKNSILLICLEATRRSIEEKGQKVKQEIDQYVKKIQEYINPIFIDTLLNLEPENKPFIIKQINQFNWYLLKNIKPYRHGDTINVFIPYINIVLNKDIFGPYLPWIENITDFECFLAGSLLQLKNLQQKKAWECKICDNIAFLLRNIAFGLIDSRKGNLIFFHTYQDIDSSFRKFLQSQNDKTQTNQFPDFYLVEEENCNIVQLDKILKEKDKEKNLKKTFESLIFTDENSTDINPLIDIVNMFYTNRPLKRDDIYLTWATIYASKKQKLGKKHPLAELN